MTPREACSTSATSPVSCARTQRTTRTADPRSGSRLAGVSRWTDLGELHDTDWPERCIMQHYPTRSTVRRFGRPTDRSAVSLAYFPADAYTAPIVTLPAADRPASEVGIDRLGPRGLDDLLCAIAVARIPVGELTDIESSLDLPSNGADARRRTSSVAG